MFAHPLLNRAIIVKHNVAPGEEDRLAPRRFNATKVIFPLDPSDLNLGGQFLFIDQHDFVGVLSRHLEYEDLPLDRDVAVLRVLDRLPTLDPFLVREALAKEEIEVDRCYFRFSQPDKAHMLGFVEGEMGSLIKLCFGELRFQDQRTKRLSRLLLADYDAPDLAPLQVTLQMDDRDFSEAMFSWKAVLYYRWRIHTLTNPLKTTLRSISRLGGKRSSEDTLRFTMSAKSLLENSIAGAWRGHRRDPAAVRPGLYRADRTAGPGQLPPVPRAGIRALPRPRRAHRPAGAGDRLLGLSAQPARHDVGRRGGRRPARPPAGHVDLARRRARAGEVRVNNRRLRHLSRSPASRLAACPSRRRAPKSSRSCSAGRSSDQAKPPRFGWRPASGSHSGSARKKSTWLASRMSASVTCSPTK